jgi:hypothetical protein
MSGGTPFDSARGDAATNENPSSAVIFTGVQTMQTLRLLFLPMLAFLLLACGQAAEPGPAAGAPEPAPVAVDTVAGAPQLVKFTAEW